MGSRRSFGLLCKSGPIRERLIGNCFRPSRTLARSLKLEAFVRDVMCDAGDELTEGRQPARICRSEQSERQFARAEHFKIALDLPGAVGLHFTDREGVADDVLGGEKQNGEDNMMKSDVHGEFVNDARATA
jgi:hypothetical protein